MKLFRYKGGRHSGIILYRVIVFLQIHEIPPCFEINEALRKRIDELCSQRLERLDISGYYCLLPTVNIKTFAC